MEADSINHYKGRMFIQVKCSESHIQKNSPHNISMLGSMFCFKVLRKCA